MTDRIKMNECEIGIPMSLYMQYALLPCSQCGADPSVIDGDDGTYIIKCDSTSENNLHLGVKNVDYVYAVNRWNKIQEEEWKKKGVEVSDLMAVAELCHDIGKEIL